MAEKVGTKFMLSAIFSEPPCMNSSKSVIWSKLSWTLSAKARTLGSQPSWDLNFVNLHHNINLNVKFHQNRLILKIGYGFSMEIVEEKKRNIRKRQILQFSLILHLVSLEPYDLGL